ncbi:SigE family RNA polymerase sigma factor [Streptomyces sp. WAC06614]|uniref:SigE family RNA polymerase sigma factor n=1 Tax=Streptomyces sp. WAC06614 TaxID=2487416 RepID=UPI0021AFE0D3|nr:SigE family RNA polymerase sigma factor [Streptomyces sp. WAC06614]
MTLTDVGAVPVPRPPAGTPASAAPAWVAPREAEGPGDFDEFAAARWDRLVRIAFLLTGDFHEAEDLVQTTLIKVHGRWHRLRPESLDAYVRRALVNTQRSRLRRRTISQLLMSRLPDEAALAPSGPAVEEQDAMLRLLHVLAPRQRAVLVLRFWEDMTEEETARVLDCSVGTVKSQASKALRKLRGSPLLPLLFHGPAMVKKVRES